MNNNDTKILSNNNICKGAFVTPTTKSKHIQKLKKKFLLKSIYLVPENDNCYARLALDN